MAGPRALGRKSRLDRLAIIGKDYYGCRNHIEMATCPNDLRIRREAIERIVLTALAEQLPVWVDTRYGVLCRPTPPVTPQAEATRRQRLQGIRPQAERIMRAI